MSTYVDPYVQIAVAQDGGISTEELVAYDLMKQWPRQTESRSFDDNSKTQCNTNEFDRGSNDKSGFAKRIRQSDVDSSSFYGYFQGSQTNKTDIAVGQNVPGNHSAGKLGCHEVYKKIVSQLFGDRRSVLAAFYDLDEKDGDEYPAKAHSGGNNQAEFLNAEISKWTAAFEKKSGATEKLKAYVNVNIRSAFERCWEVKDDRDTGFDIYDKSNYDKQWNTANTGYSVERVVEGGYNDGESSCDTLFEYVKENKLLDNPSADEEALKNDQDEAVADANGSDEEGTTEISDCSDKDFGWNPKNWIPNALDWFGCTVAKALLSVLKSASDWIADNLETTATTSSDVKKVTESDGTVIETTSQSSKADDALKAIWSNILNIANVLFVIAFLIMIISTALGIGVFDAYTVKKFLPRIIIAAIAANLSWSIAQTMISITNALGGGLHEVIMGPIRTIADSDSQIQAAMGAGTGGMLAGIITAATIPAIVAVVNGGIFVLVPAVMALLFAALTAIVIIMVRKLIIFGLIITAPLAITMWAIPSLDNWAGRWWKMFVQMLMVYPYIMGLFALGEFASLLILITNPSDSSNPIPGLTAIALLAAPLFMLPTVFKMASSTLGNLTGMINNKGKGIFDRGSNWGKDRAKKTKRNMDKEMRKGWREQSKHHHVEKEAFQSLKDNKAPEGSIRRRFHRNRDISAQIQRAAEQKASAEDLQQAQFASFGIDLRNADGTQKKFTVKDKNGNIIGQEGETGKDDALAYATAGHIIEDENGRQLFDGSSGAQRAAAGIIVKQGLVPAFRTLTEDVLQRPGVSAETQRSAMEAIGEAMDANTGSMMPKMPSYFKGDSLAFRNVEAGGLSGMHETEVGKMFQYIEKQHTIANDTSKSQEERDKAQAAYDDTWNHVGQAVKQITTDPAKYNMSPSSLAKLKTEADRLIRVPRTEGGAGLSLPDNFDADMAAALDRIDGGRGVIN